MPGAAPDRWPKLICQRNQAERNAGEPLHQALAYIGPTPFESCIGVTCLSCFEAHISAKNIKGARDMPGPKNRLPDIDPAIAQAQAVGPAPLAGARKAAVFTILAMALLGMLKADWSRISPFGRSQQVSVATDTVGSR
jgi:hypothetical protein